MRLEDVGGGGSADYGYGGTDGTGLIDPDLFPLKSSDIDIDGVLAAARGFKTMGERVQTRSAALTDSWAPLAQPAVYDAPEAHKVHRLMRPAVTAGEEFNSGAMAASGALTGFATRLFIQFIPIRLKNLEEDAREFRDEVKDGVPRPPESLLQRVIDHVKGDTDDTVEWYEHLGHIERNKELLQKYADILESISRGACDAAEIIHDIPGMPTLPDPEPYDADAIAQSPMPWGSPRSEPNETTQITLGTWNILKSTFMGLANLVGWDGDDRSLANAGNAWKRLGNGLLGLAALGIYDRVNGVTKPRDIDRLLNSDDPLERWFGRRMRDGESVALPFVGGTSVDIEDAARRWKQDPWEVGTETALTWLLLFLPGPKVGKGVPVSPAARTFLNEMLDKAELIQTGSGWFTKGGIRVADETGRWLGNRLYGGTGGKGGTHMWTPGEPEPPRSGQHGGAHKWEPRHKAG